MFKKVLAMVLGLLGVQALTKGDDGKSIVTDDQKATLTGLYGEAFTTQFLKDLAKHEADPPAGDPPGDDANAQALADANTQLAELQTKYDNLETSASTEKETLEGQITTLQGTIATLSDSSETDPPPVKPGTQGSGVVDHTVALFGETKKPWMATEGRPWNQRAAVAMGAEMVASSSIDYSNLATDLGAYYRTRKDDSIKSFVRKLPTLERYFPLESGYQDQTVLVNLFLSEFSQAFQDTYTAKGGYEMQPEILKMFDVKFDHKFTELKNLEKQWIGYLNREGADAMKWSFIEYILAETAKKLHNERENRRMNGVYLAPTPGVAGYAINAASGLRRFMKEKIAGLQIKTFELGEWTTANIVEYIFDGSMLIPQDIRDTGELVCYISSDAKIYYDKNFESLYGANSDYTGPKEKVKFIKSIKTVGLPFMGSSKRVIWTIDGNIKFFEDKPGEMYKFNFEQEDRSLKVWADWREGTAAILVGKKFASASEQDYEHQLIWCNDVDEPTTYFVSVAPDDTTPSVTDHTSIKTGINTGATAITDIDDMVVGQTVIVKCGSDDANNTTIAKAGNFAAMTAAWAPDIDDTITLYKRAAGDIIDIARTTAISDAIVIAADDVTPDVAAGTKFVTSANTGATAITDLDNPTVGETYTIYGGSDTDSSSIADAGNFDLTAAMTLGVGTWIKLYCRADNDYVELDRG